MSSSATSLRREKFCLLVLPVKRRLETFACLCALSLALFSIAGKKHQYKTVRPMEVPDGISDIRKAEPVPPQSGSVSKIAPATRATSVMVIDARTGEIFYEKNADAPRPAASTQKLLTALIVADRGYLDRPVTVEPVDTMAEPVKLNIRPGETYSRIELLRALPVQSPNDVARCLARDSPGSIEARQRATSSGLSPNNARSKDRKTTRLNSSHRSISNAVFCL